MKIRILGGGIYGCHLALALRDHHEVELHEIAGRLFNGASGNGPARGHRGFHYPRSAVTRAACQEHVRLFEARYGHLTHCVPINIYAIAKEDSLVDFGTYKKVLIGEVEFIIVERPDEHGLQNVEGALMTGERHVVVDRARDWFTDELGDLVYLHSRPGQVSDSKWDLTIDCTFCANDEAGIDRFEACITVLLEGPTDRAITIMDGKLPGIYVWNEDKGLTSLTSALYTPLEKFLCHSSARQFLNKMTPFDIAQRSNKMVDQMAIYYPRVRDEYKVVGHMFAVRALPKSASDSRLIDVVRVGDHAVRVRAGKIDAIFSAEKEIKRIISTSRRYVKDAMVSEVDDG